MSDTIDYTRLVGRTCMVCGASIPDIVPEAELEDQPAGAVAYNVTGHPQGREWECNACSESRFTCNWCNERFPIDLEGMVDEGQPNPGLSPALQGDPTRYCSEDCRDRMNYLNETGLYPDDDPMASYFNGS